MKVTAEVVEGFVRSLLLPTFDDAAEIPDCHREWWRYCCSDHKFIAIAAPRGHAKSTAITLGYVLAKVCFRESHFVIIVSDTEAQSILFLNDIKKHLTDNEHLVALFGIKGLIKDSETDIIAEFMDGHVVRLMAKGSEQKMRGLKWNSKRPDLIVCDDIENDELVMSKERREKFQRWFNSALLPVRSDKGIVRVVGTILHASSLLEGFMPRERDKDTVNTGLKMYSKKPFGWFGVKYAAHNSDMSQILWEAKKSREFFIKERSMYQEQGLLDLYSREYLNRPIDESNTHFRRSDFLAMTDEDREKRCTYYITIDLAVTQKTTSDYTVFMVAGVDPDGYVQIRHIIRERFDALQIVEMVGELAKLYDPVMFVTEKGAIINSIMPSIKKWEDENNAYFRWELVPSTVDKLMRSQAIRARARAGKVKIDKDAPWYPDFEEELLQFPRASRDDQVDCFSLVGVAMNRFYKAPTDAEILEQEEDEEFKQSGLALAGQDAWTGY